MLRKEFGDQRLGIEGYEDSRWILLDFGDVVVHLFDEETRSYYDLEHLWAGAKRVPFEPPSHPVVVLPPTRPPSNGLPRDPVWGCRPRFGLPPVGKLWPRWVARCIR